MINFKEIDSLFFINSDDISVNDTISLDNIESQHCVRVLRKKKSDTVFIFNGLGSLFIGELIDPNPKMCKILISNTIKTEKSKPYLHVAIAPTKQNERLEWFIEKAIEIGINEISLLNCNFSERRKINIERFNKVAISACKQSLNLYLPKINPLVDFNTFVKTETSFQKLMAYIDDSSLLFTDVYKKNNDLLVLIGPEGDFSKQEVKMALDNNFKTVSLGTSRLRTETAAVFATSAFKILNF